MTRSQLWASVFASAYATAQHRVQVCFKPEGDQDWRLGITHENEGCRAIAAREAGEAVRHMDAIKRAGGE